MVARLVRDQEVVGSSPVTSTTKKRRVFALRFFVFADANPRPLPFYRAPGNRSKARFSGRGGAERARGRRPAGAARESSRPRRRGFKSRHLDHEKAKGFALRFFVFADANPRPLFIIFHCYIYVRRIPQALPPADFSLRNRDLYLIIPLQYAGKHDQLQRKPGLGAVIAFCSIHQLREYPSALLFGTVGA